jgi:hypothetical protein
MTNWENPTDISWSRLISLAQQLPLSNVPYANQSTKAA